MMMAKREVNLVAHAENAHMVRIDERMPPMQSQNKFFEDISQLMTNAMGVAQGAKDEAETAMKSWMDRWLADTWVQGVLPPDTLAAIRNLKETGAERGMMSMSAKGRQSANGRDQQ